MAKVTTLGVGIAGCFVAAAVISAVLSISPNADSAAIVRHIPVVEGRETRASFQGSVTPTLVQLKDGRQFVECGDNETIVPDILNPRIGLCTKMQGN